MVVVRIVAVRSQSALLIVVWVSGHPLIGVYRLDLRANGLF